MRNLHVGVPLVCISVVLMMSGVAYAAAPSDDTLSIQLMILGLCLTPVVYFLPSVLAATRDHPAANGVFAVNLLFGWTVAGWIAAMVWVLMAKDRSSRRAPVAAKTEALPVAPLSPSGTALMAVDLAAQEIEELTREKLQSQISEAEYDQRRKAILDRWKAAPVTAII
jgi:hypothetical protein